MNETKDQVNAWDDQNYFNLEVKVSKYINTRGISKENWLFNNGLVMPIDEDSKYAPAGYKNVLDRLHKIKENFFDEAVLVVVVCNGAWNAAVVCESNEEFMLWADPSDPRPRLTFLVNKQKALAEVRDYDPNDPEMNIEDAPQEEKEVEKKLHCLYCGSDQAEVVADDLTDGKHVFMHCRTCGENWKAELD